jgi:hypothetical protein
MKKVLIWLAISAAVIFGAYLSVKALSKEIEAQTAADRYGKAYTQLSIFYPETARFYLRNIHNLSTLIDDQLSDNGTERPWKYCLSGSGYMFVKGDKGAYNLKMLAVDGDYFYFHPMKLRSGGYISGDDLMKDRVVLNVEAAWLLTGSIDIAGLTVDIMGRPYVVAGVVENEQDSFNQKAVNGEAMIIVQNSVFMGTANCLELLLPEEADGFLEGIADRLIMVYNGTLLNNSKRYTYKNLWTVLKGLNKRVMVTGSFDLPYWENAARMSENCAALCFGVLLAACASALISVIVIFALIRRLWKKRISIKHVSSREKAW